MTVAEWLDAARADALRRGLPDLVPALEGLAKATEALRAADWNDNADGPTPVDDAGGGPGPEGRPEGRDRRDARRGGTAETLGGAGL